MNKTIEKAARRYLSCMGYDILGRTDNFLVCDTEEGITFVHIIFDKGNTFPKTDREELKSLFEQAQVSWFMGGEHEVDVPLLCDELSFLVLSDDRALIRHAVTINFYGD